MPNCSKYLSAALLVLTAAHAKAVEVPPAQTLLDAVLAPPTVSYQGRVMVTHWYGKQARAEEMRVYVLPPDNIRREFLSPDGSVNRISVSDGDVEVVHQVRSEKKVRGDAVRSYEKVLSPEAEREALISNYELSSSTAEKVAGRPTWRLMMKPKSDGKPWQTLWIDPETKVVLRTKRFMPKKPFATQAQFSSFETGKPLDPQLFAIEDSSAGVVESRGMAPDFLTLDQLNKATGDVANLPEKLPGGFIFESADAFRVNGRQVRHARYTDGLTVTSVFLTDRPVKLPKGGVLRASDLHLPGPLRASSAGKITSWGAGRRHYMLMGDVSRELVAEIVKALR